MNIWQIFGIGSHRDKKKIEQTSEKELESVEEIDLSQLGSQHINDLLFWVQQLENPDRDWNLTLIRNAITKIERQEICLYLLDYLDEFDTEDADVYELMEVLKIQAQYLVARKQHLKELEQINQVAYWEKKLDQTETSKLLDFIFSNVEELESLEVCRLLINFVEELDERQLRKKRTLNCLLERYELLKNQ